MKVCEKLHCKTANIRRLKKIKATILKCILIFKEEFCDGTGCIHIQRDECGGSARGWVSGHPAEFPMSCTEAQSWSRKCPAVPWPCRVGEGKLNAQFSCICQVLSSTTAGGRLMTQSSGACCRHKLKTNPISINAEMLPLPWKSRILLLIFCYCVVDQEL